MESRTINVRVSVAVCIAIILVIVPFSAGLIVGSVMGDDAREIIAIRKVHGEMKAGVKNGVPFFLRGSDIKLYPRSEKVVRVQIAGAGDQGMRKVTP